MARASLGWPYRLQGTCGSDQRRTVGRAAGLPLPKRLDAAYRVAGTDTGFGGDKEPSPICSFWLVSALAMIGETDRVHALCQKLLSFGGKLLLYAGEIETTTGEHLGNFPQAFTHLPLIEAVSLLIASEPEIRGGSAGQLRRRAPAARPRDGEEGCQRHKSSAPPSPDRRIQPWCWPEMSHRCPRAASVTCRSSRHQP
jgi:hypothetical protein